MSSMVQKPVFAITNFGTRLVVPVSLDCTAGRFKNEFESVHFSIFPQLGRLRVDSLEVKWESLFYRLTDSVPLESAFTGEDRSLHILASKSVPLENKQASTVTEEEEEEEEEVSSSLSPEEQEIRTGDDSGLQMQVAGIEGISEPVSETISVSGIINKYFSTCGDEVNSYSMMNIFPVVPQTHLLHDEHKRTSVGVRVNDKQKRTSVGERVMEASRSFRISSTKNCPARHLSKLIDGGLTAVKSANNPVKRRVVDRLFVVHGLGEDDLSLIFEQVQDYATSLGYYLSMITSGFPDDLMHIFEFRLYEEADMIVLDIRSGSFTVCAAYELLRQIINVNA